LQNIFVCKTSVFVLLLLLTIITLLSMYLLENLDLSQSVGGIRLGQGKEIHPFPVTSRRVF
jgi:hypothetical protein